MKAVVAAILIASMVFACSDNTPEGRLARLQKQAYSGDSEAQYELGLLYENGTGVPKDLANALHWYQKSAAQGNAKAQFNLGWIYAFSTHMPGGFNTATNLWKTSGMAMAVESWTQEAGRGDASAQIRLAWMCFLGNGVPADAAKAVEWLQKPATDGDAKAQVSLGVIYSLGGPGLQADHLKVEKWYYKAATQGDHYAQYKLGETYYWAAFFIRNEARMARSENREPPKEDPNAYATEAAKWYHLAAMQGNVYALSSLASMYEYGKGVPHDAAKSIELYMKAASQGDSSAQGWIAGKYLVGLDLPKDLVLACAWRILSASSSGLGDHYRSSGLFGCSELSPTERAEAERLSSRWKPGQVLQREGESALGAGATMPGAGTPAKKATGTAFIVSTEGHAITNHHVVANCSEIRVQGRTEPVQLLGRDGANDLALLKMPGEWRFTGALAPDPASLRQGQEISVFGFPLESMLSSGGNITPGVVSAITGFANNTNQFQITASIQPGSSGSPVLDKKGHVVGVVNMKLSDFAMARTTGTLPQNVNFAISGQTLKSFLDATRVSYKTGWSFFARDKSLADLSDEARKWTTIVECWQ